jgi:catechol 2,3-dioxygenase-like lactoylglutathione lyase family enzyme
LSDTILAREMYTEAAAARLLRVAPSTLHWWLDGRAPHYRPVIHTPAAAGGEPENPPPNTLGLHRVIFAVKDIEDVLARLRAHGAELLGEVAQYEDSYQLCYLRGPEGIIVALAEQIR